MGGRKRRRQNKAWRKWIAGSIVLLACLLCCGCGLMKTEETKLKDLNFVVLSEERIPKELKTILGEKKKEPFQITYKDMENLYICVGYGEKETGGYSIAVDSLYLTDSAIHVKTVLIGPDAGKKPAQTISYPMIVIRTEYSEDLVVFD